MQLFDPLRPKLPNARPTWLRDHIAISHFEIFPRESGALEVSIWLPIHDATFASMRFTKILGPIEFLNFLKDFTLDPEKTCEELFIKDSDNNKNLQPELRRHIPLELDASDSVKIIKKIKNQPLNLQF